MTPADKKKFYDKIRSSFPLTAQNVSGFDFLIDTMEMHAIPLDHAAYMLATVWVETAQTMLPIKEYGGEKYFKKMYDIQGERPTVARSLGNIHPGDGVLFPGRGYVQITGRANYKKFGIEDNPQKALDRNYAFYIMSKGMREGLFTGKKLTDYFNPNKRDPVNARRIINGVDRASEIARYFDIFRLGLLAGSYGRSGVVNMQPDIPVVRPETKRPGFWATLGSVIAWLFTRRT